MRKIVLYLCFLLCLAGLGSAQIPSILPSSPIYETLVLLKGARIRTGQYLNFGPVYGTSGYGIKDNSGTLQYKNSGGAWANLGGGGASTFIGLTDVPAAFTGAGGYLVRVNAGETALEFVGLSPTINATGFSLAGGTTSKSLTVELDSLINQDLTTDASPSFSGFTLGSITTNGTANFYGIGAAGYFSIIKGSNAEGLTGIDTRIGLDESNRTVILCDRGDIATDFGLAAETNPTFNVRNAAGDLYSKLDYSGLSSNSNLNLNAGPGGYSILMSAPVLVPGRMYVFPTATMVSDNLFSVADVGGYNQTFSSSNSRQAWGYFAPIIAQSGTAAFDGIRVNATLTSLGSGATGDGNNLLNLSVSGTSMNRIDIYGHIHGGELASLADTAVLTTHIADTWVGQITVTTSDGYCAVYRIDGAALTAISANAIFTNTKGTDNKWNFYIENNVCKLENQIGTIQIGKVLFLGY